MDVSRLALVNSLDIQIARFDAYMARTSLGEAESIFDTFLNAEGSFSRDKGATASTLLGTDSKSHSYSLGIEKKVPTGTTIEIEAAGTKTRSNSAFSSMNPYTDASLTATITQELGKNFFGLSDRADIKITKLDIENSDFTSLEDIEQALFDVQFAYWMLVRRQEELNIAEEMLDTAEELYNTYKEKYELGLAEETEFLAIEALLYSRRSNLLVAKSNRKTAKNNLLFLLNQGQFHYDVDATEGFGFELEGVNLYQALKGAVENRRDYKRVSNKLKKNAIEIVVKKNALWPQIDLEASFSRNNIALERDKAWENLLEGANDEVSLTLTFSMPLENRKAKSQLKKVNYQKAKLLLELKRTERLVLLEINDKVNEINTFKEQAELYKATVKIQAKKLEQQIKRLRFGRSNVDILIDYEEDLLQARQQLAVKLFDYKVALISLDSITDSLLDKYWQEPL